MRISDWSSRRVLFRSAQPILSGRRFMPVDSEFERSVLRELIKLRRTFDRYSVDLVIEKPVFDTLTPIGPCRPDFLLEARSRSTSEIRQVVVEAMGSNDATYLLSKAVTHPRMEQLATLVCVSRSEEHTSELQSQMRTSNAGF